MPRAISIRTIAGAAALLLAVAAGAAQAEEQHRENAPAHHPPAGGHPHPVHGGPMAHGPMVRGPMAQGHPDFRGFHGDPRHWDAAHFALWRGGGWHHDCHFGRCGWWWFVDGGWYWYAAPVYPYPLVVSTVVAFDPAAVPPPVPAAYPYPPAPPPPAPTNWYCASTGAYYPYAQACPTPWQPVPAR
jgi:hypothetical protein